MEDSDYSSVVEDSAPQGDSPAPADVPSTNDASASAASGPPSDEQILAFVEANIDNPALIAETAAQYGVSVADLSRATGYDTNAVVSYFEQHDVAPPASTATSAPSVETKPSEPPAPPAPPVVEPPIKDIPEPPRRPDEPPTKFIDEVPPKPVVEPPKPPTKEIVEPNIPQDKAVTTPTTTATTPAAPAPIITDYKGNQFDGAQVLNLAQQIAQNAGSMSGGAFQTKGGSIGFDASETSKLLGRDVTASEQVLLDMARQMISSGVTDLSQLQAKDITTTGQVFEYGDGKLYVSYALDPNDPESGRVREVTPEEAAKITSRQIMGDEGNNPQTVKTIEGIITGKGLFAGDKLLTQSDAVNHPLEYAIGNTYTGEGGTNYQMKYDANTGKPVFTASGFSTSDANLIAPVLMIASNFLLPGAGSLLTSSLLDAGMSEFTSQIVSKAVISGVTSGIMAEASGSTFGDGFLKGTITGGLTAGLTPMIQMALPSDLSPAVATTLAKAGTAVVTALATGQDPTKLLGTTLLNSAVSNGLSLAAGETGLSTSDARLLTTTLTPIVSQLVTKGNVSADTLMNTVLMGGSTILANVGSDAVNNIRTLTTGDGVDTGTATTGGLTTMQNSGDGTLSNLASTVTGGLGAVSSANNLLNVAKSLTNPTTNVNTTKANLVGALNTGKTTPATKTTSATKITDPTKTAVASNTFVPTKMTVPTKISVPANTVPTKITIPTKTTVPTKITIPTNTAVATKSKTSDFTDTSSPTKTALKSVVSNNPSLANTAVPKKIDVANLKPKKKTVTTPLKVDVSTLTPMSKMSGLTALKQTTGKG
jgi:hypothetical protein